MVNDDQRLSAELTRLCVATLHEANYRRGLLRGLRLLVGPAFAGPASTVWIPAGDNLGIHRGLAAVTPGAVLCVASCGEGRYGVLGELLMAHARQRSVSALVLEDGCRDVDQLCHPPSVAAMGVAVQGTVKRRVISRDRAISIGGVLVNPGDWIIGDSDGVVAIQQSRLDIVVAAARLREQKESRVRRAVGDGATVLEALATESGGRPANGL
jgi:4-hydroxy-4-methyl-2-oxoglutarate aldolase